MVRKLTVLAALLLVIAAPVASASMFRIGLYNGTADLVSPEAFSAGFVTAYDHSELGISAEYWHSFSPDYALALSATYGFFKESDEPGDNALPGSTDSDYSQTSFSGRIGGDRMVRLNDKAMLYFGPGIEVWSGKAKFEGGGAEIESESTMRISLDGRLGGVMMIGPSWGLSGHVAHKIGYASAEDAGAKATWWPSSFAGAGGLTFVFGGGE